MLMFCTFKLATLGQKHNKVKMFFCSLFLKNITKLLRPLCCKDKRDSSEEINMHLEENIYILYLIFF